VQFLIAIHRARCGIGIQSESKFSALVFCSSYDLVSSISVICPYQEYVDGMHNYPFKELTTDAFISSTGNLTEFVRVMRQMQVQCKARAFPSIYCSRVFILFLGRYTVREFHRESRQSSCRKLHDGYCTPPTLRPPDLPHRRNSYCLLRSRTGFH
jgi:hypothetical protein